VRWAEIKRAMRARSYLFALVVAAILFVANIVALPQFVSPKNWGLTMVVFAPFALMAIASVPAIVSGGGGVDLSIGPLANTLAILFGVKMVGTSFEQPAVSIPILLGLGLAVGVFNGCLVTILRFAPVIATLCTLLVLNGIALKLAPAQGLVPPNWTGNFAKTYYHIPASVYLILTPCVIWVLLQRTAFVRQLYAVGGNDAAAFSSGVNVTAVRIIAYALGGLFAAIGGIAIMALFQTADPTVGTQYTLIAVAAVSLGGATLAGGRGGVLGGIFGAAIIYLARNLLSSLHVDPVWLQVVYGIMLVVGVVVGAIIAAPVVPRRSRRPVHLGLSR